MMTRDFHLGDVLSVATERLVSPRGMSGVHELCDFLTGQSLYTHQLIRAFEPCQQAVLAQHPQLAAIEVPEGMDSEEKIMAWLATLTPVHGTTLPIEPMPPDAFERRNPIDELADMVGPEKVLVVDPSRPKSVDEVAKHIRETTP